MHSLLENYMAEVSAHLKPVPAARREEELREMRQHLLNAVAVNQETGQSEDDAATNAVRQFGTPEAVGEAVVSAWLREDQKKNRQYFYIMALSALLLTGANLSMSYLRQHPGQPIFLFAYLLMFAQWAYLTPRCKKRDGTYGVPAMGLPNCVILTILAPVCWVVDNWPLQYTFAHDFWSAISSAMPYVPMLYLPWYYRHRERLSKGKMDGSSTVG